MSGFFVVIPARLKSERLPRKPLLEIAGMPMIEHVFRQARQSAAREVIVATDSDEIEQVARAFGADVERTDVNHASGTDRIAEVARRRGWADADIVVNVQGDEPLIPPALIDQVARLLEADRAAGMATLMTPLAAPAEYTDPNMANAVIGLKKLMPQSDSLPTWHLLMNAALLTMLPPTLVILILQRWFVKGLVDSGK